MQASGRVKPIGIIDEESFEGGVWEASGRHLGGIREASGRHLGSIWEASGRHLGGIWEASGRHLGLQEAMGLQEAPSHKNRCPSHLKQKFNKNVDFTLCF